VERYVDQKQPKQPTKAPQSCLYEIQIRANSLSVKEQQIAHFILSDPSRGVNPSLEELAETIGVSDTTLFRFVKKLGYSGYQQFRIALATETLDPHKGVYDTTDDVTDAGSAIRAVFARNMRALEQTLNLLDPNIFDRAAQRLAESRKILFMGLGGSNSLAQDGYHKFLRTGLSCVAPGDFHLQLMAASQIGPGDSGLLISHSGTNRDAISLGVEVKKREATLLLLTSQPRSPLGKMADYVLVSAGQKSSLASEAFSARLAQLSIMDALYLDVMKLLGNEGLKSITAMREVISERRL